jgi:hypothetical protein
MGLRLVQLMTMAQRRSLSTIEVKIQKALGFRFWSESL